jgi:SmpA / OmlA family
MPFATPDFGAGATIWGMLCVAWVVVLVLTVLGIAWGAKLLKSESPKHKRYGLLVVLVSGLVPLCCLLLPPQVVRMAYGNYPLGSYPNGKIREGMTRDEVTAILGSPHEHYKRDDEESWYYWIDSFGIGYFGVRFGPKGRVIGTHGN